MRVKTWAAAALVTVWAGSAAAEAPTLPLKKVRLYEVGVGYFERTGVPAAGSAASLPVPSGHLDDALKTLVVLSRDASTTVGGVEFASSVSEGMARAVAGLDAQSTATLGLPELLGSLKGAGIELKTKSGAISGRLVEVLDAKSSDLERCVVPEKAKADAPCVNVKQPAIVLMTDKQAIHRLALSDVLSVRPTDEGRASRLRSAIDALSRGRAQQPKQLQISSSPGKSVTVGYVAETPVWRSTYRLVLDDKSDDGVLQGWALLHNDTDEDWKQVSIELVNGRPTSFLFPLAAPRYARRQLVTPENDLSTIPQLLESTVDALWGDEIGESFGAGGLGLSGVGEGGGGRGEGIGLGSIGTIGHGAGSGGPAQSSMLSVGNLAGTTPAEGVEAGALFRYALPSSVNLSAHSSALVPFAQVKLTARRIAWFENDAATAKSAVHLTNAGQQTLPDGPISVFADGGFAGESAIDRLKPKESRVIEFGLDLDVELTNDGTDREDETRLVAWQGGGLVEHFVRRHRVGYVIENKSGRARSVFVGLSYVQNAKVAGADEVIWDQKSARALAVFRTPHRAKVKRTLVVNEGLSRPVGALSSTRLREIAAAKSLPASQRAALEAAAGVLIEAEVRLGAKTKKTAELAETERDILRLRANARAVGAAKSSEIVRRLLAAEDRGTALRKRIGELSEEARERTARAERILSRLSAKD